MFLTEGVNNHLENFPNFERTHAFILPEITCRDGTNPVCTQGMPAEWITTSVSTADSKAQHRLTEDHIM